MRRILYFLIIASAVLITGCSKIDLKAHKLEGTFWTGEVYNSIWDEDEHDSVSFDFHKGYADFTYLEYATNNPETGVALYEVKEDKITFSKANDMLDGTWTITELKGGSMTIEMVGSPETKMAPNQNVVTIVLKKRN